MIAYFTGSLTFTRQSQDSQGYHCIGKLQVSTTDLLSKLHRTYCVFDFHPFRFEYDHTTLGTCIYGMYVSTLKDINYIGQNNIYIKLKNI